MNQGKYVFAQIIEFLSHNDFLRCVARYKGNHKVKTFTCWHQLLYMIFGQLANRESLSDLILCLQSQANKTYHLGMGKGTSKANLAKANEHRDYRIYEDFALGLVAQIQQLDLSKTRFTLSVDAPVYAIDASIVDLCLNIFWWGKFRQRKAAVKMHTMMDVKTNIPTFIYITSGSVHELSVLDEFPIETGAFYVLDRGYIDFTRLHALHQKGAFYITRAKTNFTFRRICSRTVDKSTGLRCDQSVRLQNRKVLLSYPDVIRRVKYVDAETKKEFVFMTNNLEISALQVAQLYKYRWTIELFFKWIKQHLKVKTFWGYSFNAVKTQIYIAIISYLLVALIKHHLKLRQSQYEILQILSVSLLCKTPLPDLFENQNPQHFKEQKDSQLTIFTL